MQAQAQAQAQADGDDADVVRVLCPVDRIGELSRLSVAGARIRFDCASASPFPSDRVLLVSAPAPALPQALLAVLDRLHHSPFQQHQHQHPALLRLLLSPSSPLLAQLPALSALHPAALLRVFPKDHAFPAFQGPAHHLLTISGSFPSVHNALLAASPFLLPPPSSTTHLLLPSHYLPFVTPSDAAHIQHISGARLTLQPPTPGETTAKVIIFGTPHQTKTAQSLVHGLVFCGVFDPS